LDSTHLIIGSSTTSIPSRKRAQNVGKDRILINMARNGYFLKLSKHQKNRILRAIHRKQGRNNNQFGRERIEIRSSISHQRGIDNQPATGGLKRTFILG